MLILWIALLLTESVLALILWMLREDRRFPAFTFYVSFQVLEAFTLQCLHHLHSAAGYFYAYEITFALDVLFKLWVLVEVFHKGFQTELVERRVVVRFYALVLLCCGFAAYLALSHPSRYPVWIMAAWRTADLGASLALCLTLGVILLASWWDGVYWLHHPRGIALGFLLYLPLRLLIRVLAHSAGRNTVYYLNWLEPGGFLGALLVWVKTFIWPEVRLVSVNVETLRHRVEQLTAMGERGH